MLVSLNFPPYLLWKRWSIYFCTVTKILLFHISTHQISILRAWFSFKSSLLPNIIKKALTDVMCLKENREHSQQDWIWKICNMQIMPTNKSNFSLKHKWDLYHISHGATYWPIVFIINISFYFNSFSFVQDWKGSNGHIILISTCFFFP